MLAPLPPVPPLVGALLLGRAAATAAAAAVVAAAALPLVRVRAVAAVLLLVPLRRLFLDRRRVAGVVAVAAAAAAAAQPLAANILQKTQRTKLGLHRVAERLGIGARARHVPSPPPDPPAPHGRVLSVLPVLASDVHLAGRSRRLLAVCPVLPPTVVQEVEVELPLTLVGAHRLVLENPPPAFASDLFSLHRVCLQPGQRVRQVLLHLVEVRRDRHVVHVRDQVREPVLLVARLQAQHNAAAREQVREPQHRTHAVDGQRVPATLHVPHVRGAPPHAAPARVAHARRVSSECVTDADGGGLGVGGGAVDEGVALHDGVGRLVHRRAPVERRADDVGVELVNHAADGQQGKHHALVVEVRAAEHGLRVGVLPRHNLRVRRRRRKALQHRDERQRHVVRALRVRTRLADDGEDRRVGQSLAEGGGAGGILAHGLVGEEHDEVEGHVFADRADPLGLNHLLERHGQVQLVLVGEAADVLGLYNLALHNVHPHTRVVAVVVALHDRVRVLPPVALVHAHAVGQHGTPLVAHPLLLLVRNTVAGVLHHVQPVRVSREDGVFQVVSAAFTLPSRQSLLPPLLDACKALRGRLHRGRTLHGAAEQQRGRHERCNSPHRFITQFLFTQKKYVSSYLCQ
eukprot:Rhum_TRINITY_DN14668_c14_g1::Rhum_TRINITY_DN14668_c14_g1_i1::g.109339::m.109339